MKLDKSKPHGVISGEHFGAVFEQDGRMFDESGDEVVITQDDIDAKTVSDAVNDEESTIVEKKVTAKKAAAPKAVKEKRGPKAEKVVEPVQADPIDAELSAQTGV